MNRAPALVALALAAVGCGPNGDELVAVGTLERDRIEIPADAWETLVELKVASNRARVG